MGNGASTQQSSPEEQLVEKQRIAQNVFSVITSLYDESSVSELSWVEYRHIAMEMLKGHDEADTKPTRRLVQFLDELEFNGRGSEPVDCETFVAEHLSAGVDMSVEEFDQYGALCISESMARHAQQSAAESMDVEDETWFPPHMTPRGGAENAANSDDESNL